MYAERPEAFSRFSASGKHTLVVPSYEIIRRKTEYKEQSEANPHRRGPKRAHSFFFRKLSSERPPSRSTACTSTACPRSGQSHYEAVIIADNVSVLDFPRVVSECLLVDVAEQVERLHFDVRAVQTALRSKLQKFSVPSASMLPSTS